MVSLLKIVHEYLKLVGVLVFFLHQVEAAIMPSGNQSDHRLFTVLFSATTIPIGFYFLVHESEKGAASKKLLERIALVCILTAANGVILISMV